MRKALHVLDSLEHRGASGAELDTGDGAGILLQVPDLFFREEVGFELPPAGEYGVGVLFLLPREEGRRKELERIVETAIEEEGQRLLGWRDVPVDHDVPGPSSAEVEPLIRQVFIGKDLDGDQDAFERKLYVIRRVIERRAGEDLPTGELREGSGWRALSIRAPSAQQTPSLGREVLGGLLHCP